MGVEDAGLPEVSPQLVRSARVWMRAYPGRWRAERGEELFWLLADLAGPDPGGIGAQAAFDLVRGGWATRWRRRPSVHVWLLYRMFDRRIPSGYRGWAQDDIEGLFFPVRRVVGLIWWWFVWTLFQGTTMRAAVGLLGLAALSMVLNPGYSRRQHLLKHVAPQPGEPVTEGSLVTQPIPRRRVAGRACLQWYVVASGTVAVLGVGTMLGAPTGMWARAMPAGGASPFAWVTGEGPITDRTTGIAIVAAALVLGLCWMLIARNRLRRCVDVGVDQPYRTVVGRPSGVGVARIVVGLGAALAWLGVEISGQVPLSLGIGLTAAAVALLPVVLVALVTVGRSRPGLAGSDVWSIVVHGHPAAADIPLPALRPLAGPVPPGAVMAPRRLGEPPSVALP